MNRKETLDAAADAVLRDRAATHGYVEGTFGRIAALWNAYLGDFHGETEEMLSPADVAMMMALLKVARQRGNPAHADNYIDLAGYAACGAELAAERP